MCWAVVLFELCRGIEAELAELISANEIAARIDSHRSTLHARRADQRSGTYRMALAAGEHYLRNSRALLLRASLMQHDLIQVRGCRVCLLSLVCEGVCMGSCGGSSGVRLYVCCCSSQAHRQMDVYGLPQPCNFSPCVAEGQRWSRSRWPQPPSSSQQAQVQEF
jgi:hypothetical protein